MFMMTSWWLTLLSLSLTAWNRMNQQLLTESKGITEVRMKLKPNTL